MNTDISPPGIHHLVCKRLQSCTKASKWSAWIHKELIHNQNTTTHTKPCAYITEMDKSYNPWMNNSLWSSDAIWWHRSGSTLAWVMACVSDGTESFPTGLLKTNFNQIVFEIQSSSFKKMHLKMSTKKCWPFCLCFNVFHTLRVEKCNSSWLSKLEWYRMGPPNPLTNDHSGKGQLDWLPWQCTSLFQWLGALSY